MWQTKLFEMVFLCKYKKVTLYWINVGIKNWRMKQYGMVKIWLTLHILPCNHHNLFVCVLHTPVVLLGSHVRAQNKILENHDPAYHGLVFLWCFLQVQRVVFNHVFREVEITLFYSGIINVRWQLGFVLFIQYCFGTLSAFCWPPFLFFLEEKHGRFIRQSVMSLSSISNECDDSFLLSLSELLST